MDLSLPARLGRSVVLLAGLLAVPPAVTPAVAQTPTAERPATSGYPGNLPFFYDIYTFRGDRGKTDVVAAFAVPAGELRAEEGRRGSRYRFDVSLVLADTARRTVSRTDDSVFVPVRRRLHDDHLIYTQVEVAARPSRNTVQRVVMTEAVVPGVGQLYHSPFPIPDYSGDELMLSDIALGQPAAGAGGWRRGGATLALLPTTQFPSSSFDVYYEIYNLPYGHAYATEIEVEAMGKRAAAGLEDPVGLRFHGEAAPGRDDVVNELRGIQAALDRGSYRLTVTVTDLETGASASRSRRFQVRGWDGGATLVGAHPWRPDTGDEE